MLGVRGLGFWGCRVGLEEADLPFVARSLFRILR